LRVFADWIRVGVCLPLISELQPGSMAEDLSKTEQAGFLAHLVKPINFEQLHRVLEQFVSAA